MKVFTTLSTMVVAMAAMAAAAPVAEAAPAPFHWPKWLTEWHFCGKFSSWDETKGACEPITSGF
ncbi:uncharacterized protein N7459_006263 [Penicillium hispanicum]|uniref:uncharacterized protein n=1 Tax=Penicillium hispanicum TaxID=1080232 RepID=UPI00254041A2|nr:uncharacterized protein N7459_006263 [Penicillium hispanicum]KAJ5580278.1 hypothetical protein N7459_006263 [Penicillium hispanicum]